MDRAEWVGLAKKKKKNKLRTSYLNGFREINSMIFFFLVPGSRVVSIRLLSLGDFAGRSL